MTARTPQPPRGVLAWRRHCLTFREGARFGGPFCVARSPTGPFPDPGIIVATDGRKLEGSVGALPIVHSRSAARVRSWAGSPALRAVASPFELWAVGTCD